MARWSRYRGSHTCRSCSELAEYVCNSQATPSGLRAKLEEICYNDSEYTDKVDAILLWACRRGWTEFVVWFLERFGSAAVKCPVRYHVEDKGTTYKIYQLFPYCLIEKKKCTNLRDFHTESLLHAAAFSGSCKTVSCILQSGASVNDINCCGQTPLSIACHLCHIDVCKLLLEQGACVNHQDAMSYTPMMYACSTASKLGKLSSSLVHLLLQYGADVHLTNEQGLTALHVAVTHQNAYALEALFSNGHLPTPSLASFPTIMFYGRHLFGCFVPSKNFSSICQVITSSTNLLSPEQRAEMYLLLATMIFEFSGPKSHLDPCKRVIEKAFSISTQFSFTRDDFKVLPLYETYFLRIQNFQDLTQMLNSSQSVMYEHIAYLCLVVRECLLGPQSLPTIALIFKVGLQLFLRGSPSVQCVGLWLRASIMLRTYCESVAPDLESVQAHRRVFFRILKLVRFICKKITSSFVENTSVIVSNVLGSVGQYLSVLYHTHFHTPNHIAVGLAYLLDECVQNIFSLWKLDRDGKCPVSSVSAIGKEFIHTCPEFIGKDLWPTNVLHFCVISKLPAEFIEVMLPAEFIEAMLQWGASKYINSPVGLDSNRPLHYSQESQVTSVLLEYGAHFDAVNGAGKTAFEDQFANDCSVYLAQYTPSPLACLSAKAVVTYSIRYLDIDYPQSLKTFIGYHDPSLLQS